MGELVVVVLDGVSYGIWRESVVDVGVVKSPHRLSLAGSGIAVLSVVGDRAEAFVDLAVCLGHPPTVTERGAHVLRVSGAEPGTQVSGFLVGPEITSMEADPDESVSMPAYLRTPVIDTCAARGSLPIPIINIPELLRRVLDGDLAPVRPACALPAAPRIDLGEPSRFRGFIAGGSAYATASEDVEPERSRIGPVARLPLAPPWVRGITLSRGRIVATVDLALRLTGRAAEGNAPALIASFDTESIAFLVDADQGLWERAGLEVQDLPPIVRTPWMRSAVVRAGQVAPIIDFGGLLSWRGECLRGWSRPDPRAPRAPVLSWTNGQDLEVLEVSLLGTTHAILESETEGIVQAGATHEIVASPETVAGVAEYEGELLPVVDLAPAFGRSAGSSKGSSLILHDNGCFRALVMVDGLIGVRRLEPGARREIPLAFKRPIVHGCYTDGDAVRLILNVEALAFHVDPRGRSVPVALPAGAFTSVGAPVPDAGTTDEEPRDVGDRLPEPLPEAAEEPLLELRDEAEPQACEGGDEARADVPPPSERAVPAAQSARAVDPPSPPEKPAAVQAALVESQKAQGEARGEAAAVRVASAGVAPRGRGEALNRVSEPAPAEAAPVPTPRSRRRRAVYAALGVLPVAGLAAALLLSGLFPRIQSRESPSESVTPSLTGHEAELPTPASPTEPQESASSPGEAVLTEEYVVRQGDTLWSIAERFSGNPFDYARLAEANGIPDPDLIYPGQRIVSLRE